MTSVFVKFKT